MIKKENEWYGQLMVLSQTRIYRWTSKPWFTQLDRDTKVYKLRKRSEGTRETLPTTSLNSSSSFISERSSSSSICDLKNKKNRVCEKDFKIAVNLMICQQLQGQETFLVMEKIKYWKYQWCLSLQIIDVKIPCTNTSLILTL